jgi:hypothetical protein
MPTSAIVTKSKKGVSWEVMSLTFQTKTASHIVNLDPQKGAWFLSLLPKIDIRKAAMLTRQQVKDDYEAAGLEDFELFWDNKPVSTLYKAGLFLL